MQYQVQEMLRAERIFEPEGIAEELAAYNPLIPDGSNWKVTLLHRVPGRRGAAARSWRSSRASRTAAGCRSAATTRVFAIADEDLERENDEKTSAVHFLRFELDAGDDRRRCAAAPRSPPASITSTTATTRAPGAARASARGAGRSISR